MQWQEKTDTRHRYSTAASNSFKQRKKIKSREIPNTTRGVLPNKLKENHQHLHQSIRMKTEKE
jgi:hypothetical protein